MNSVILGLNIVATPIGNLEDISERAINTIKESDYIICENPKHSLKLLNNLGIKKKLIALHDYNEELLINKIKYDLGKKIITLISDAGSPLISDPGYKLVRYCIENNVKITSVPGPSSVISGLQLSGLPLNEFSFVGFLPKTKKQIYDFLKKVNDRNETVVFFVSSHKVLLCLEIMSTTIDKRKISVLKEMTKINEKVFRGLIKEVHREVQKNKANIKGEFVFVVDGQTKQDTISNELFERRGEIKKLLSKFSLTEVVEIVHKLTGIRKNKVYKWVLDLKK